MNRRDVVRAGFCLLAVGSRQVHAETYPARPVMLFYPYAAGGAATLFGQMLAERLRAALGAPVLAESRPGAGGIIGGLDVVRAKPDGYTLLLGATGATLITPFALPKKPFDPTRDLTAIALLTKQPMTFIVNPSFPARTLGEAVDVIRANPGKHSYASAGPGALAHLGMEFFKLQAGGLNLTHIPYKGGAPALTDVIGGHVPMLLENLSQVVEHHRAGRIRVLAVLGEKRSPLLPDVPTAIEQGYAGMDVQTSYILMAPLGMPDDIVARLSAACLTAVKDPAMKKFGDGYGIEINQEISPESAAEFVKSESEKWSRIIQTIGFKASS